MKQWAIVIISGLLLFAVIGIADAVVSTSTHYQIQQDTITPVGGGENTTSTHYKTTQSIGEQASGADTSDHYRARGAFRYLFNPVTQQSVPAPTPSSSGGGSSGGILIPITTGPGTLTLGGFAAPKALVKVFEEKETKTVTADTNGAFSLEITDLTPGQTSVSIWSEDANGTKSVILTFSLTIQQSGRTALTNIFLSPTITVANSEVPITGDVKVSGQTTPKSSVLLKFSSNDVTAQTTSGPDGQYSYSLPADKLGAGDHVVIAQAKRPDGTRSAFSPSVSFSVMGSGTGAAWRRSDLNHDRRVDLVDLSILLANWGNKPGNTAADVNEDGTVDLVDVSIMLYNWTGER